MAVAPSTSSLYSVQWTDQQPLDTPHTLANPQGAVEDLREAVRRVRAMGHTLNTPYGDVRFGVWGGIGG